MFCDWLFLVFSGVSLQTAANFLLFLDVAISLTENLSVVKTELIFYFFNKLLISSSMREEVSKNANC